MVLLQHSIHCELIFAILIPYLTLLQMPTAWVVASLVPIAGGVALASATEVSFNWWVSFYGKIRIEMLLWKELFGHLNSNVFFFPAILNRVGFLSAMASNLTNQSRNVLSKKLMVNKEVIIRYYDWWTWLRVSHNVLWNSCPKFNHAMFDIVKNHKQIPLLIAVVIWLQRNKKLTS